MEKVDIEFAHIYTDEIYSQEQEVSIDLLKSLLLLKADSYIKPRLNILIDDYNPEIHTLNISEFIKTVQEKTELDIDAIALESKLVKPSSVLIENLEPERRRKIIEYIQTKKKYPCSLLAASWYLIRLGLIDAPDDMFISKNENLNYKGTKKIINLLPLKYKMTEESTLDILKKSSFKGCIRRIESIYY